MAAVPHNLKRMVLSDSPKDVVGRLERYLELVKSSDQRGRRPGNSHRGNLLPLRQER